MRNVLLMILVVLVVWDWATTYYGTLSILLQGTGARLEPGVIDRVMQGDLFIQLISLVFAIGLIVFILAYRIILNAKNKITLGILGVGFIYDFATSFYGTLQAGRQFEPTIPVLGIIALFALICTSAPLLISHIYEQENEPEGDVGA